MATRKRQQNQVRAYLTGALYARILREAAARGTSLSLCVRADLEEIYALRDEVASLSPAKRDDRLGVLTVLAELVESRASRAPELLSIEQRLRRLEAMIDRHYAGTMVYLPSLPEQDLALRTRAASLRYEAWQRAVKSKLAEIEQES
jgi:hypothetical protein